MKYAVIALSIVGGIWFVRCIAWPILEAIIYGHVCHVLTLIRIDWREFQPNKRTIKYITLNQWTTVWDRLSSTEGYVTEVTIGNYTFTPPFRISKNHPPK